MTAMLAGIAAPLLHPMELRLTLAGRALEFGQRFRISIILSRQVASSGYSFLNSLKVYLDMAASDTCKFTLVPEGLRISLEVIVPIPLEPELADEVWFDGNALSLRYVSGCQK
jgi:hypothetical protein